MFDISIELSTKTVKWIYFYKVWLFLLESSLSTLIKWININIGFKFENHYFIWKSYNFFRFQSIRILMSQNTLHNSLSI